MVLQTFKNQNLQGRNLQGQSFRNQDLSGLDFSNSYIRSTDFTGANLSQANFSNVQAGQQLHWYLCSLLIFICLSVAAGLIVGWGGGIVGYFMFVTDSSYQEGYQEGELSSLPIIAAILLPPILFLFANILIRKGLNSRLGAYLLIVASVLAICAAVLPDASSTIFALILFLFILCFVSATVINGISIASASFSLGKNGAFVSLLINFLFTPISMYEGASIDSLDQAKSKTLALLIAFTLSSLSIALSFYVGRSAALEDERYNLVYKLSVYFSSLGGTKFRSAICTDTDFSNSLLKSANFKQAILKRTKFFGAQGLRKALLGNGYLKDPKIRNLVVSGYGNGQNFDYQDLRDVNLEGSSLVNSSLIATNLCEANLRDADLSNSNLTQTQLYKADLGDTCLTGACIQDWGISTDTNLQGVKCDYIYMRNEQDPCRKPDNLSEVFKPGDFADFITPIIKTLDLYKRQNVDPRLAAKTYKTIDLFHREGIDPSAAAIALNRLAEQHPEAGLEVVALEGRRNERVRLQARVSSRADPSELSQEYSEHYGRVKELSYNATQALLRDLEGKDNHIRSLENIVKTAIQQPKFYVQMGDIMIEDNSVNIEAGGDLSGVVVGNMSGVMNLGTISGNVTNSINQISDSNQNNKELKDLLLNLQTAIESEESLSPEDKSEALEQVQVLAEAGQEPESTAIQKAAKTSIKILKGTVASLPDATKLVEACSKLLPAIATLLALV